MVVEPAIVISLGISFRKYILSWPLFRHVRTNNTEAWPVYELAPIHVVFYSATLLIFGICFIGYIMCRPQFLYMRPNVAHSRPIFVANKRHLVCRRLYGKAFPDSRGPGNPKLSAHCQGPGNGSVRHSVVSLCEVSPLSTSELQVN